MRAGDDEPTSGEFDAGVLEPEPDAGAGAAGVADSGPVEPFDEVAPTDGAPTTDDETGIASVADGAVAVAAAAGALDVPFDLGPFFFGWIRLLLLPEPAAAVAAAAFGAF